MKGHCLEEGFVREYGVGFIGQKRSSHLDGHNYIQ